MKHLERGAGGKFECVVKEGLARSKLKGVHKLCYMCGFEAVSGIGLKIHMSRKHEEIPQLVGESPSESETNCW